MVDPYIEALDTLRKYVEIMESMFPVVKNIDYCDDHVHEYACGIKIPSQGIDVTGSNPINLANYFGFTMLSQGITELGIDPRPHRFNGKVEYVNISRKKVGLIWRVKPEMDCMRDFETMENKYRIYARYGFYSNE